MGGYGGEQNAHLRDDERTALVAQLMGARRAVRAALGSDRGRALADARASVDTAKVGLGERGPVWWDDDVDLNRHMARNNPTPTGMTRSMRRRDRDSSGLCAIAAKTLTANVDADQADMIRMVHCMV